MENQSPAQQVTLPPEEDARLPILEAEIESFWMRSRPKYLKSLKANGTLKSTLRDVALDSVRILHRAQNRGLNPDQGRELMWDDLYTGIEK